MTTWSDRAEAYRKSPTHREGPDLDLVVEWCEPAEGVKALDVATGGGHVARRLREAGAEVVTLDPSPGMRAAGFSDRGSRSVHVDIAAWQAPPDSILDERAWQRTFAWLG